MHDHNYLTNHLLIASPLLNGSYFEKAVIYLCRHNDEGAMGVVINRKVSDVKQPDLFKEFGLHQDDVTHPLSVYIGGPVDTGRGFVLHSNDYKTGDTEHLTSDIALSCNRQVLLDLVQGHGPSQSIVALGYAGWDPGQLELELQEGSWIHVMGDRSLVFDTHNHDKWRHSAQNIGIDFNHYASAIGHS